MSSKPLQTQQTHQTQPTDLTPYPFNFDRRHEYLDISDLCVSPKVTLYSASKNSRRSPKSNPVGNSRNQDTQVLMNLSILKKQSDQNIRLHEQLGKTSNSFHGHENPEEITPKKVSEKHNFVKAFIGKLKTVLKSPKLLNFKRRGILQNLKCLSKIYWYFFHEIFKRIIKIGLLRQFLAEGAKFEYLDEFKQFAKKHQYEREDINLQKINELRKLLREKIIESDLLELCRNSKMEKKEAFVSWAQEFIEDLRVGEVKTQRV